MNPEIKHVLDDSLARIRAGATVESCLKRHPEHAQELSGLLQLALALRAVPAPSASTQAIENGRAKMLAVVAEPGDRPVSKFLVSRYAERILTRITGKENPDMRFVTRFAMAVLLAAFGVLAASGAMAASAQAIPGDLLYPVKTTIQDMRLYLAPGGSVQENVKADVQATRQADVQKALDLRRVADVHYLAQLTAFDDHTWTVGGHILLLAPETQIVGRPYLGASVSVLGRTRDDGTIVAVKLVVDPDHGVAPDNLIHYSGELAAFDDRSWTVGGHRLLITPDTYISGEPYLGARVDVTARKGEADALVALALVVRPRDQVHRVHFTGVLTAMDDRSWTVGDRVVLIVPETEIVGEPYIGAVVKVTARLGDGGRLIGIKLIVERSDRDLVRFFGVLTEFTETQWVVAGRAVQIVPETNIVGEPFIGAIVQVLAWPRGDGLVGVKLVVRRGDFPDHDLIRFSGRLTEFSERVWIVANHRVRIVPDTKIVGEPFIGAHVHVLALPTDDGALIGVLLVVERPDPLPDERVHYAGKLTEINDRGWVVGGHLVRIVPETQIVGRPRIGAQVEVIAWLGPDGILVGHKLVVLRQDLPTDLPPTDEMDTPPTDESDLPPSDRTDVPPSDETDPPPSDQMDPAPPDPAGPPADQGDPAPETVHFVGELTDYEGSQWKIGGKTVIVTTETHIVGQSHAGARVRVLGILLGSGKIQAHELVIQHADGT